MNTSGSNGAQPTSSALFFLLSPHLSDTFAYISRPHLTASLRLWGATNILQNNPYLHPLLNKKTTAILGEKSLFLNQLGF